ncbi:hypothetical protein ACVW0P_000425 [Mucilaginibacter sp. UYNi724]
MKRSASLLLLLEIALQQPMHNQKKARNFYRHHHISPSTVNLTTEATACIT